MRDTWLRAVAVGAFVTASVTTTEGLAQPADPSRAPSRLAYLRGPGAESCPPEQALRDAVAELMGRDPFVATAEQRLTATITRSGRAFISELEIHDAAGTRIWSHPPVPDADCGKLVRLMALSIAIAIDPFPRARPAAPLPPPSPPLPVAPVCPPALPPVPAPAPPEERAKFRASLGAALELGSAPRATAGFLAAVGVRWPLVSLSFEGRADLPTTGDAGHGARVRTALLGGSLVPCLHHRWMAGCAVVSAGSLRGQGLGVGVPETDAAFYWGAGARLAVDFPVSSAIALRLFGDLLGTIQPSTARISARSVWVTAPVTGALGGATVVEF